MTSYSYGEETIIKLAYQNFIKNNLETKQKFDFLTFYRHQKAMICVSVRVNVDEKSQFW